MRVRKWRTRVDFKSKGKANKRGKRHSSGKQAKDIRGYERKFW
jgi:hypothetical protein